MYTIGEISEMFHIPISTLRYYDKEGLFQSIRRSSGIRQFGEKEIETLQVIACLKRSGMEIKDIKLFMEWCAEGSSTYPQRLALFERQKEAVEQEMARLERTLAMIRYKCWYYEQACAQGTEDGILAMLPDSLPPDIQVLFDKGHRTLGLDSLPKS